jgi:hypothetical protein
VVALEVLENLAKRILLQKHLVLFLLEVEALAEYRLAVVQAVVVAAAQVDFDLLQN